MTRGASSASGASGASSASSASSASGASGASSASSASRLPDHQELWRNLADPRLQNRICPLLKTFGLLFEAAVSHGRVGLLVGVYKASFVTSSK